MTQNTPQVEFEVGQVWKNLVTLDEATVNKVVSRHCALANSGTRNYTIKKNLVGTHWEQLAGK